MEESVTSGVRAEVGPAGRSFSSTHIARAQPRQRRRSTVIARATGHCSRSSAYRHDQQAEEHPSVYDMSHEEGGGESTIDHGGRSVLVKMGSRQWTTGGGERCWRGSGVVWRSLVVEEGREELGLAGI